MATNGVRLEVAETRWPGDAAHLAREAAAHGGRLVVAAGGDGTIAEVANGLDGSGCRLGVIPLGTANVLAHELGLPRTPLAIAAALAFGRTQALWPGLIHRAGRPAAAGPEVFAQKIFVQMLGLGFDAQVVHGVSASLKRSLGRVAYIAQSLRELPRYRFGRFTVVLDGAPQDAGSVIISKGHYYGGGFLLAPGAHPDQPGFSVALFEHAGPFAALMYSAALPLNLIPHMPGLRLIRAREVVIESDGIPAQADGDAAGSGPLMVRDAPRPIEVVVG